MFERSWTRVSDIPEKLAHQSPESMRALHEAYGSLSWLGDHVTAGQPLSERLSIEKEIEGLLQLLADMLAEFNPLTALFEMRDSIEAEELFAGSAWSWNRRAYEDWQKTMGLARRLLDGKNPLSVAERTALARQALARTKTGL